MQYSFVLLKSSSIKLIDDKLKTHKVHSYVQFSFYTTFHILYLEKMFLLPKTREES